MKAKDLMIGDIVAVNKTPLRIAALGTAKAGFLDAKGEMFYHYYDNIAPIPLTAEILQKNSFVESHIVNTEWPNGVNQWTCESTDYTIYVCENGVIWWLELELSDYADNIRMSINCVHELQHALKLCGIDKTIEL